MQCVIGVTSFIRPDKLRQFLASVTRFYPSLALLVADNGNTQPWEHPRTQWLRLPFDAGLSACRNALIDACDAPYLMICEDDFVFTAQTNLAALLSVLEHDTQVGFVGAPLWRRGEWYQGPPQTLTIINGNLCVKSMGQECHDQQTRDGTPYVHCEMTMNFGVGRREFFADHRWNEDLKLGEHIDFFCQVKHAGKWTIAHTPACTVIHDVADRSEQYNTYRRRATRFNINPQIKWAETFSQGRT